MAMRTTKAEKIARERRILDLLAVPGDRAERHFSDLLARALLAFPTEHAEELSARFLALLLYSDRSATQLERRLEEASEEGRSL